MEQLQLESVLQVGPTLANKNTVSHDCHVTIDI